MLHFSFELQWLTMLNYSIKYHFVLSSMYFSPRAVVPISLASGTMYFCPEQAPRHVPSPMPGILDA
jgi:hypothetical protein